jgi:hypothetical protein
LGYKMLKSLSLKTNTIKVLKKTSGLLLAFVVALSQTGVAIAATTPDLGTAVTFGILASTYTNTAPGTTINGDLGYTTGPATAPTVNGNTHAADGTYAQAGIDQGTALVDLNNQPCDFSYASGAIDLASDVTTPDGVGQFTPGVYCIDGAASIGGGGTITLTGAGTYIFRMDGALTTSANSVVELAGGASACDVFWTPTAATTLGANSTFAGTDIDDSDITIGSTVTWEGRALAFGGTVTTDTDTITVPTCDPPSDDDDEDPATGPGDTGTTPGLPSTGSVSEDQASIPWEIIIPASVVALAPVSLYLAHKKRSV